MDIWTLANSRRYLGHVYCTVILQLKYNIYIIITYYYSVVLVASFYSVVIVVVLTSVAIARTAKYTVWSMSYTNITHLLFLLFFFCYRFFTAVTPHPSEDPVLNIKCWRFS